jgi:hypothetical protein
MTQNPISLAAGYLGECRYREGKQLHVEDWGVGDNMDLRAVRLERGNAVGLPRAHTHPISPVQLSSSSYKSGVRGRGRVGNQKERKGGICRQARYGCRENT